MMGDVNGWALQLQRCMWRGTVMSNEDFGLERPMIDDARTRRWRRGETDRWERDFEVENLELWCVGEHIDQSRLFEELERSAAFDRLTRVDRDKPSSAPANAVRRRQAGPAPGRSWQVGDQVMHASFGVGEITHTFGSGEKISIAVKFAGMGPKILDPRLAPIEPMVGGG